MVKNIFFSVAFLLLCNACTKWKIVEGEYDPLTFVPRGLFITDDSAVYCGARQGLFKLDQDGKFIKLNLPVKENTVLRCLAKNNSSLFAGFEGGGLFRSDNNGQTWQQIGGKYFINDKLWGLLSHDSVLIAVTWPRYIYRSYDNGETWTDISNGMPEGGMGVCFGHSNGLLIKGDYIFTGLFNEGVYRMGIKEKSWRPARNGLPLDYKTRSICAMGNTLFCATEDGVYRSEDNGLSWIPSNKGIENTITISLLNYADKFFVTTNKGQVFYSSDNGISWQSMSKGLYPSQVIYDVKIINEKIYITADGLQKVPSGVYVGKAIK